MYKGVWYWSFSPYAFSGNGSYMFVVNGSGIGRLDAAYVNDTRGAVAPVINLKADYVETLIGDGTINNPYREVIK